MPKQLNKPKTVPESVVVTSIQLFTEEQVEALWGVPVETLRWWRRIKTGPEFVVLGPKTIRYSAAALDSYVQRNTHTPSMQASSEATRVHL